MLFPKQNEYFEKNQNSLEIERKMPCYTDDSFQNIFLQFIDKNSCPFLNESIIVTRHQNQNKYSFPYYLS